MSWPLANFMLICVLLVVGALVISGLRQLHNELRSQHRLRTQIATVYGMAMTLREELPPAVQQKAVDAILEAATQALEQLDLGDGKRLL